MNEVAKRIKKPRCFQVYALAPQRLSASEANHIFNEFIAEPGLPLALYHDHFIGQPGGLAIFFAKTSQERDALLAQEFLKDRQVEYQPLIFSYSPAAFDAQIAFTLKAYRGLEWERLQKEKRPSYGNRNLKRKPLKKMSNACHLIEL
jgi:hypothetical protein